MAIHPQARQKIDAYLSQMSGFAAPICRRLRALIRSADPGIVEDWKWGPNFNKDGMICGFGAFKSHVTLTFFQGSALKDPKGILVPCSADNAHNRSIKFTSVGDIDPPTLVAYVREAARLNRKGVKAPVRRAELPVPGDFGSALLKNAKASAFFDGLSPGYRRDYLDWIREAKRPETRSERIKTIVRQCSEGKTRNWKYTR